MKQKATGRTTPKTASELRAERNAAAAEAAFRRALAGHFDTPTQPTTPLFHYTDEGGLRGILQSGAIWATHYTGTNDSSELLVGEAAIVGVAKELAANAVDRHHRLLLERLAVDYAAKESLTRGVGVYLACFTPNGDDLSQWRGYGGHGAGYAIGFSRFPEPSAPNPAKAKAAIMWRECIYDREVFCEAVRNTFRAVLDACTRFRPKYGDEALHASYNWLRRLAAMRQPQLKHHSFHHEREWRLAVMPYPEGVRDKAVTPVPINSREGQFGRVEYLTFPLKVRDDRLSLSHIYLGPTHGGDDQGVRSLLEQTGYDVSLIRRSTIPFRVLRQICG